MDRYLEFIETKMFTDVFVKIGSEDILKNLQKILNDDPERGDVIKGTGGLRKLRIALPGKGKRGGARLLYLFIQIRGVIYLIYVYKKNELNDIPPEWKKKFKVWVEKLKKES